MNTEIVSSADRRTIILEKLKNNGQVSVNELADIFQVSQETIRRDLNKLEEQRLIKKIHGGAVSSQFGFEMEFNERAKIAASEKKAIARSAVKLFKPGDSLFIDFGTTTLEFTRQLAEINDLTVITNSPLIANVLHENDSIKTILIGGEFISSKFECVGAIALDNIKRFFVDYAVIGAGAVHTAVGVMDQDINEATIARQMIENSSRTVVLADGHKLQNHATTLVCEWDKIHYLFTTNDGSQAKKSKFPDNVQVTFAKAERE
ncbi:MULTISPECIES: DeoR/GlpR family DNA-binding transcription regulator [Raoultella]|jgi:DeoR/GlpR family transcriptional regulator of sugar metabolism|uniref:DeoR/GlpR family DNA-binding transcription regulator n=1 Tax=Raoultella TaxID=160674 RepID=UPI0009759675|nr:MULTISPECIES: DeoR/GlpR family DNA-binding transcription regulator [Raoultella]MCI1035738.1 DeoR/GlpR transcriptional regulator [Raoultella terrigena]MCS4269845.1 DeoR/GlpR family transcriptional regulator of sugar metabolism [Raoultella sp. BIGb0132]MCS4286805.1 DeoR/GlpR family transcriptional regulator of sugar metabolism [Raoultella terrigena]OMP97221.1 DeoR family transcriptional regulator [Raoultella terrigena]TDQ27007.1 DeoR family transcriptional regulator [Raoultella sp. BIGb0149]